MSQGDDLNGQDIVVNVIDDPVITFPDAVTIPAFEFYASMWSGLMCKVLDSLNQGISDIVGKLVQLFLGGFGDDQFIFRHPCSVCVF